MNQPDNFTLAATLENESSRRPDQQESAVAEFFAMLGRYMVLLALVAAPWMYGSVQTTAQYWLGVAVLLGLAFWWFETALNRKKQQSFPYIFFLVFAGILIGLLQLLPMEGWVDLVGGRQSELYRRYSTDVSASETGEISAESVVAQPRLILSMDRAATRGQLRLLVLACAGLLLGCRLFRRRNDMLLLTGTLAINGACLTFFGLIQKLTAPPRTVYWLELSQGGQPFGPFVNRNNAAGYLLLCFAAALAWVIFTFNHRKNKGPMPMVSKEIPLWRQLYFQVLYLVSELTALKLTSLIAAILIASGVIATLSRGGVLAFVFACIVTLLVYGMARRPKNTGLILLPFVGLVVALASWLGFADQLVNRFENTEVSVEEIVDSEKRLQNWRDTFSAVKEMGWFGSGLGTYGKVHRLYRNDNESTIFEFAENQYFQALIEAGWAGAVLFVLAWTMLWAYSSILIYRGQSDTSVAVGTAGVFLVFSQGVASMVDFGLYLAANMLTLAVLVGFVAYHAHSLSNRLKKRSWLQFQFPNLFVQVVLLLVFAGATLTVVDSSRHATIERHAKRNVWQLRYDELDLEETDRQIEELSKLASRTVSVQCLNQLGELWVHRCRLGMWENVKSLDVYQDLPNDSDGDVVKRRLWAVTRLSRLYENFSRLKSESEFNAAQFLNQESISFNLSYAYQYFVLSRQVSPLQPRVHLQLARIHSVFNRLEVAQSELERAIELAPGNTDIRIAAGLLWLQQGQQDRACAQFKRALELRPKDFKKTLNTVFGLSRRFVDPLDAREVFDKVIPDEPRMLYQLATEYVEPESLLRLEILEKADLLLGEVSKANKNELLLSANLKLQLNLVDEGMELLNDVLVSYPGDNKVRYKLTELYLDIGQIENAEKELGKLLKSDSRNKQYKALNNRYETLKRASRNE